MNIDDTSKKALLTSSKTIAIVGLSPKEDKPSNTVAKYLRDAGYKIIPVNPGYEEILGETCYSTLSDIPGKIDIVDVFMRAENVMPVVEEAIKIVAGSIWLQEGIINEEAKMAAENKGITFFMNICIKKEHERLFKGNNKAGE